MRIIELNLTNFKGFTGKVEMDKLELFTGPHGAGKSRVSQAIQFVLLGHMVEFSSVKADVLFRASSQQEGEKKPYMEVEAVWDTGFRFSRRITKSITKSGEGEKNAKYAQTCSCDPLHDEKTKTDFDTRLAQEVDPKEIMFSLDAFHGMSSQEKKRFILRLNDFDHDQWNADTIEEYLSDQMLTKTLLANDEAMYNDYKNTITSLIELYSAENSIEENCSTLLNHATKKEKEWKTKKKEAKAATVKLTEIKNETDANTRGLQEDQKTLKLEQQNLVNLNINKTNNDNQIKNNKTHADQLKKKRDELQEATEAVNPYDQANLEKLIAEYDGIKMPELEKAIECKDLPSWKSSLESATNIWKNNEASVQEHRTKISGLNTELNDLNSQKPFEDPWKGIERKIQTIETNIKKLEGGTCPLMEGIKCETDFTPFIISMKQQIEKHLEEIDQAKDAAKPLDEKIAAKEKEIKEVQEQLNNLINTSVEFAADVNKYKGFIKTEDQRVLDENKKHQKDHATALKDYDDNKTSLNLLNQKLTECKNFATTKANTISRIEFEITELEKVDVVNTEDPEVLEKMIEVNKKVIADLEQSIKDKNEALINLKNQQSAIVDINKATNMHFAYSKLKKHLGIEGILGEVLRNGLEPMRDAINKNLNILGKDVTFYFDTTGEGKKATFDYGWIVNDDQNVKRSTDALSEGENLFLSTAMLVAFADTYGKHQYKILITDNLNHLDAAAISMYLEGLKTFKYDNIIVSGIVHDRIGDPIINNTNGKVQGWELPTMFKGFNVNEV